MLLNYSLVTEFSFNQIVELLLHHHADPNVQDGRGATPLHRAASRGNLACVKLLLQYSNRIDLDAKDCDGNTAL